ncbi:MAG TPA: TIGR00730 family Rossman fold protein [Salinivirgaceae bacterium]|nr:TIGR00730 family Rossman fold protein [Salinivirgaceae bacterium]
MSQIKRIAVFCGSHTGIKHEYLEAATNLGKLLAQNNIELVYGGSSVGLMHQLARSLKKHGGTAIGVIPRFLSEKGLAETTIDQVIEVDTMHQRKAKMMELADAFIALPGGFGTLEELFETTTASQLGLHSKPIGLANICGYYGLLLKFLDTMVELGFLHTQHRNTIVSSDRIDSLLKLIMEYKAPEYIKYVEDVRDFLNFNVIDPD